MSVGVSTIASRDSALHPLGELVSDAPDALVAALAVPVAGAVPLIAARIPAGPADRAARAVATLGQDGPE
jgi:hypothetical protein